MRDSPRNALTCACCGWTWLSRGTPASCPQCRSRRWQDARPLRSPEEIGADLTRARWPADRAKPAHRSPSGAQNPGIGKAMKRGVLTGGKRRRAKPR